MITLLSPAKSLNFEEPTQPISQYEETTPRMLADSEKLVAVLQKKTAPQLRKLMGVSDTIARLNVERFRNFHTPFNAENAKAAIFAFNGDVYTGLQANSLDESDLEFAQNHLRILSGLYGVLRPLDLIQPYRLEMGTKLKIRRINNLYEFWDTQITYLLNKDLRKSRNDLLLNLASQEYFKSVKPDAVFGQVVDVHFKEKRNGEYKIISFNAKKARGAMANLIIKNRVNGIDPLLELEPEGYQYEPRLSEEYNYTFVK